MKHSFSTVLFLGLYIASYGQKDDVDWWGWQNLTVRFPITESKLSGEFSYSYVLQDNISTYFLQQFVGRLNIRLSDRWSVAAAYEYLPINDFADAHILGFRARRLLDGNNWNPFVRFEVDYLLFTNEDAPSNVEDNKRLRAQFGINPKLNSFITLNLNTEPFIYRDEGFLSEWRNLAGFTFKLQKDINLSTFLFNRWRGGNPAPNFRWQNAYYVALTIQLHKGNKTQHIPTAPNLAN